jgi:hypothetical protein
VLSLSRSSNDIARSTPAGNAHTGKPFEHAPEHAHDRLDAKDGRSIANTIADTERVEKKEKQWEKLQSDMARDPLAPATAHGTEPSKGARQDKDLIADDEKELKNKEQAKQQSAEAHKNKH